MTEMTNWFDKIEGYLENQLPPEEKSAFEAAAIADPELAAELELARQMLGVGETLVEHSIRQKAAAWEAQRLENLQKKKPAGQTRWLVFAAVLVLLALLAWFFFPGKKQEERVKTIDNQPIANEQPTTSPVQVLPKNTPPEILPEKNNAPEKTNHQSPITNHEYLAEAEKRYRQPMLSPVRGNENNQAHPYNLALAQFEKGDFEAAAKTLASPGETWFESGVYLRGHARFRARKFELAASDFKTLVERNSMLFGSDSRWNLALCYLALQPKHERELRKLLDGVLSDSTSSEQERYRGLMN